MHQRCHPAKFSSTIFDKNTVLTRKFVRDPVAIYISHALLFIISSTFLSDNIYTLLTRPQPDPAQIFVLEQCLYRVSLTKILRDDSVGATKNFATGANERRWILTGPYACNAARCWGVP